MANPTRRDIDQAKAVSTELRKSAQRLMVRSQAMAKEAMTLKQRADDLDQLIKQQQAREKQAK